MALSVEEIKARLGYIVANYGGGFNAGDAYEINARGGCSEREEGRDAGREEICDMLSDLLTEMD